MADPASALRVAPGPHSVQVRPSEGLCQQLSWAPTRGVLGTARQRRTSPHPGLKAEATGFPEADTAPLHVLLREKARGRCFKTHFSMKTGCGRAGQGKHRLLDLVQFTAGGVTAPSEPPHVDINDTYTSEARKHKRLRALGLFFLFKQYDLDVKFRLKGKTISTWASLVA